MFSPGSVVEKSLRGREACLKLEHFWSCPTWKSGRRPLPRQRAGKACEGSSAAIGAGRPQMGIEIAFSLVRLECGHNIRPWA